MYLSSSSNGFKSLLMVAIGALIALIIIPILIWNTNLFSPYIEILTPIISLFTSGMLIYTTWWSYKMHRDTFKPWLILAMGMIMYFVANFFYFAFKDIGVIPSLSMADIFYMVAYPLLVLGILFFIKKPFKIKYKNLLDSAIVMVSAFFIVWFLFIWPTVGPSQPDAISVMLSISYLFYDLIILLSILILLFSENKKISELSLVLFALGMFFQVLGDMIYAYDVVSPLLIYQWVFNVFYASNMIFLVLAIISYLNNINIDFKHLISHYRHLKSSNNWGSYLPLILVLFAYSLLILTKPDKALIWGVGIIVVMVIVRQILSLNEIRKAQKTISDREEQLNFITSNMLDLITESDEKGIFKYVSPSSKQLLGYPPEYLWGKSFYDFVHPDDAQKVTDGLKKSVESISMARPQYRYKNAEGKYLWLESIGQPIFENDKLKGFIYSTRDITEQREAAKFVKNSLREKKTLLKEIHHRVNNNLQIIISLLNLESRNVVDDRDLELFVESQNRVRTMAMIHEKLYISENLSSINFSDYLKTLLSTLIYDYSKNLANIDLELDIDEKIEFNIETSVPCGLIINEIVSNSLKHAFPSGKSGKITVKMHQDDDEYVLIVGDDGIGFIDESELESATLGLTLINSLVDQLDGDIEFLKGEGTFYKIKFQELKYKERL
ncbi:MAG: histidine kinase dimerization/phosphoacceptor domain -containing protein [Methanobacteriaceae archaeon]|nr:histidine kinase dimerization/phosphoacceptor domain -containing protein [Methanobacteriaceae archaeon]